MNEINYITTFTCVRNDVFMPYPETVESIDTRTENEEPLRETIDVMGTAYVGESDEGETG